jgi:hypothetical protein
MHASLEVIADSTSGSLTSSKSPEPDARLESSASQRIDEHSNYLDVRASQSLPFFGRRHVYVPLTQHNP